MCRRLLGLAFSVAAVGSLAGPLTLPELVQALEAGVNDVLFVAARAADYHDNVDGLELALADLAAFQRLALDAPAGIVTVAMPVKSDPSAAVPL